MNNYAPALEAAIAAARAAGELLRAEFYRPGGPRKQNPHHADIDDEAEALIRARLTAAFPFCYLGEETGAAEGNDRRHRWLVDPNDGTAAFLRGWRGSSVSIALLRDAVPILGVVYAFAYPDDDGDLIAWAEGCPLTRNGQPAQVSLAGRDLDARSIVFLSQDADRNPAANAACVHPARYIALPSVAYRLARVAAGDGIAAVSLSHPVSWDFAAGHALLRAVGGTLVNEHGIEVTYSETGESSTQRCFAGSVSAVQQLWRQNWEVVFAAGTSASAPFDLIKPRTGHACAERVVLSRAQGCLLGQLARASCN